METLFDILSKLGGPGWIVAGLFGLGYWKERQSRDKLVADFISLQKATLDTIHNNTTAFNTLKDSVVRDR